MKNLIVLAFSVLLLSSSANADCSKIYKKNVKTMILGSSAGMFFPPIGIYYAHETHQVRKMYQLIKEAKSSRIGKRTKGLIKSLNGQKTAKEIHTLVREANVVGKLCIKDSSTYNKYAVMDYKAFKDKLRFLVDSERVKKGQGPIWTDLEDLNRF